MESLIVKGGRTLLGELDVAAAKNALLPILACSVVVDGEITLKNSTMYSDVMCMLEILEDLGCKIKYSDDEIYIDASCADEYNVSEEYTKRIRSSIFMLGPLLSRFKKARVAYPGGCNIGNRPIDLHLKGLRLLNVKIEEKHGYICCDGKNMKSGEVHLDFASVGATENIMMASLLLKGTTTIYNAAREPEIEDLQNFINAAGGKVSGAGTSTIKIEGVQKLHSLDYEAIRDRIIAGTYMVACAIAGGEIVLSKSIPEHNFALISKLKQAGCKISTKGREIKMSSKGRLRCLPRIETQPYPGFPTDLQNQILTLQTVSKGTSVINETLFETRFKICTELTKMGADISINNQTAVIKGVSKLYGASVTTTDLRGGAGLVLAGLVADGYTTVEDVYHIDRGYNNIEKDLKALNADIERKAKGDFVE